MLAGELYRPADAELTAARLAARRLVKQFNDSYPNELARRQRILRSLLGAIGADCEIEPPFHCDYGTNIRIGSRVFMNFGCVLLDVANIEIGNRTLIGPGVHVYAATHPHDANVRASGLELGRPVRIGQDVWIGGCAIILPGVTIGDRAIIGAGAVVARNVNPGTIVAGNPARQLLR